MNKYYLKSFITLTPQTFLKQYFHQNKMLLDFPWDTQFTIEELHEAILKKTDLKIVESDFRAIHNWANEVGINNLIEEARSPIHGRLELGEKLREVGNEHAKAIYIWLEHYEVFYWAVELTNWENRIGKVHHYVDMGLPCNGDDGEICDALGNAIAEYYKKQSRGSRCRVDYYIRTNPTRHFFFANPEDSVKGYRKYSDDNNIVSDFYRPVFQVVFEYNPEDGDVAIHARGKKANDQMFNEFCTKVLGYKTPPNAETEVFNLSCLKNADFRFEEDPSMPVESITLKMIMFNTNKGANQRITLEADPYRGDNRQVEAMMARSLLAHNVKGEDVTVQKAKIEIKFKPVNMQKIGPLTFTVGSPQYSTLSNDDKSEMAKKYLRKWGILVKHKALPEVADANAA